MQWRRSLALLNAAIYDAAGLADVVFVGAAGAEQRCGTSRDRRKLGNDLQSLACSRAICKVGARMS